MLSHPWQVLFTPHLDGSGVAVRKWTQGFVGSWGRTDTILAVVRKPPESMQMPLSWFLRMSIITSAVMFPAGEEVGRAQRTNGCEIDPAGVPWPPGPPLTDLVAAAASHTLPGSGPWQPPCAQAAGSGRRPLQNQRRPAQSTNPEPRHGFGALGVLLRCLYRCSAGWRCFGHLLCKKKNLFIYYGAPTMCEGEVLR